MSELVDFLLAMLSIPVGVVLVAALIFLGALSPGGVHGKPAPKGPPAEPTP